MKLYFLSIILFLMSSSLFAQNKMACCPPTNSTDKFASLASDKKFVMSHEAPLPYDYNSVTGKDVTIKAADGTDAHAWLVKAAEPTDYYIFVFHEYWGLNDYIKHVSDSLSSEFGANVIALDLYDKQVAENPNEAGKLMQAVKTERAMTIIKGAYNYVGKDAKVFTIGWCFGGGWSLQAALIGGNQVKGCIMYYGMPETDVTKLKTLDCDVIGFFGEKDQWINPKVVEQFKEDMKAAGKHLSAYEYDANHAFANPSNPHADMQAAADAHTKVVAFIKEKMK